MLSEENIYKAKLREVLDGDTVIMCVYLGLGFFCNASIRLIGIDAPEIFGVKKESEEFKRGQIVKLEVKRWFYGEETVYKLKVNERECHGRFLGEIWKDGEEKSLNDYLKDKFYKSEYIKLVRYEKLKEKW